ncbi:MAG: DHH family phosphoesterase [Candidatus Dormibacteria bacterium]
MAILHPGATEAPDEAGGPGSNQASTRPLIIYHGDCPDGFGAAFAAWKRFGDAADYVPVSHGEVPPRVKGRDVLIADFAYDRVTTERLAQSSARLLVLDHHRSAAAELAGLSYCVFDMERSGAVMTWQHLHQAPVPILLQYVEDRDLWRNALPGSEEVSAALRAQAFDFQTWDGLDVSQLRLEGRALLRYQRRLVERIAAHAQPVEILGTAVPTVNSSILQSELGDVLATGHPFAGVWWQGSGDVARWSLRSTKEGVDVSLVAARYGGGGHRTAAGFKGPVPKGGKLAPPSGQSDPAAPG